MLLNSEGTERTHFVKGVVKSKRKDVYGSLSHCSPQITALPQLRNSSEIPHMFLFREALQTLCSYISIWNNLKEYPGLL